MSKSIFTAFSGAKRLLDSGRTVFEKLYDIPNRLINQTFAGADRPEFHKTVDGFEQVCVEKEATNSIDSNSTKFEGGWAFQNETTGTITQGQAIEGVTDEATLIDMTLGDVSFVQGLRYNDVPNAVTGDEKTVNILCKNIGDTPVSVYLRRYDAVLGESNSISPGETSYMRFSGEAVEDGESYILISESGGTFTTGNTIKAILFQPMHENGPYPTLFTEGTRLAPAPRVTNALPTNGAVVGVANVVRDNSFPAETQYLWDSGVAGTTNNSCMDIISTSIRSRFYGSPSLSITKSTLFPSWGVGERRLMAYVSWCNVNEIGIAVMNNSGEVLINTASWTRGDDSYRTYGIGFREAVGDRQTSIYHEVLPSVYLAPENNAEILQLLETITRGTSMQRNVDQMTIL